MEPNVALAELLVGSEEHLGLGELGLKSVGLGPVKRFQGKDAMRLDGLHHHLGILVAAVGDIAVVFQGFGYFGKQLAAAAFRPFFEGALVQVDGFFSVKGIFLNGTGPGGSVVLAGLDLHLFTIHQNGNLAFVVGGMVELLVAELQKTFQVFLKAGDGHDIFVVVGIGVNAGAHLLEFQGKLLIVHVLGALHGPVAGSPLQVGIVE